MSTVVAHEIGNPLEAIQNLLYLIHASTDVSSEVTNSPTRLQPRPIASLPSLAPHWDFPVRARKPEGVEIVVADHGSGIEPAILSTPFQFGITTKGAQGNGIGLWAVKQILQRHGGDIRAQSELGKGTTFSLWWPRHFVAQPK